MGGENLYSFLSMAEVVDLECSLTLSPFYTLGLLFVNHLNTIKN